MAMKVTPVTAVTAPAAYSGTLHSEHGDRLQHYHRQVTLMLLPAAPPGRPALRLLLDQEPQRPGEDEVQTCPPLAAARFGALPTGVRLGAGRCALCGGSLFQLPADAPQTCAGGAEAGTP